ncbi:MAG: hypothetical protein H6563_05765 [Lewinellaceae bacterium]|nr:hypothetical protein [Lewinellaceae bacterium]
MSADNTQLKSLVQEAKDACRVKVDALIAQLGSDDPDVIDIVQNLENTFEKFKVEGIWLHPIEFDPLQFVQHILTIRTLPDGALDELQTEVENLTTFLEDNILQESLRWLNHASTSDWNIKMLEAMRLIRGNITRKKKSMADSGDDPMENEEFQEEDDRFNNQIDDYRAKLKNNEIDTNQNDLKMVALYDRLIGVVETVVQFTGAYKLLNDFIEKKINGNAN